MYKQRNINIDLIKCLAIFSVIGVHFILNTANSIMVDSNIDIIIYLTYRQVFIICVPFFLLTTGYLNIEKDPSKQYYKKVLPILSVYFFYSIASLIFRNTYMQETISILEGLKLIFTFQAIPYAWYVNMFLGLYLLIPFLNKILKNSSKKEFQLFMFVLLGISVMPATWNSFNTIFGYFNIIPLPNFWMGIYPIAYYCIGGYIKVYSLAIKKYSYLGIAITVFFVSIIINYLYSDIGNISNLIKDYSSLFILIQSTCLFVYILNKKLDIILFKSLIIKISNCTLEIYLISYIMDNIVYKIFKLFLFSNTIRDYMFAIPIVLSVFILSCVTVLLLKRVKKTMVGITKKGNGKYIIKKTKQLQP